MAEGAEAGFKEKSSAPAGDNIDRQYIQQLEKRISDLEAIVKRLLKETQISEGLTAEDTEPSREVVEDKREEPPPAGEEDEWGDEEEVETSPAGRDTDARRRVTELETWRRKRDSKTAKEKEEAEKKVKFEFSGKFKLRFNIRDNLNLNNPGQSWPYDNTSYFDYRFMFKTEATYGPMATVFVLDKGNFVFDWKEDSEGTLERWGEFFTVNSAWFRELYFQYTGPFLLKAGRQNIIDPHGGIVLEGPGDGIKLGSRAVSTPLGRVSTSLSYLALAGGFSDYTEFNSTGGPRWGNRSAVFGVDNKLDGLYLNFDIRPTRKLKIGPYLLKVFDRGEFGDPDLNLDKDFDTSTTPRDGGFEPLYAGVGITGKTDKFSYKADFIWLGGSFTNTRDNDANALMLKGDYNIKHLGPFDKFTLGAEFGRGSGNTAEERASATGTMKDFNGLWLCKDRRKFGNIFSEDLRAGYFLWDSNLANVTFLKGSVGFEPFNNSSANIALLKLWTTESVFKGRGPVYDWSLGASTTTETTRDIGWEVDVNFDYQIFKYWRLFAEVGYFIPGDVYQRTDGQDADPASEIVIGSEFVF